MGTESRFDDVARVSQLMLNAIGQAVIATDLTGAVTYWNSAAVKLYGWTASEAVGRPVLELTLPEAGRRPLTAVIDVLLAGGSWSAEFTAQRRDGSTFPSLVVDSGLYADDGELVGIIGVSTDLTELKNADRARQASERRLQEVVDNSPVMVVAFDSDGALTLAEGRDLHPLGLGPGGNARKHLAALLAEAPAAAQAVSRCLAGKPADVVLRLNERHIDFRCRPDHDADGAVVGAFGIGTDITDRVLAAEQAAVQDERWRSLVSRSADVALIADLRTGALTYISPAVTRLFGWQPQELLGRSGMTLVHPDDQPRMSAVIQSVEDDPGGQPTVEFRLACADGSYRWVEESISNLASEPSIAGLVGNVRDITARRDAEEALRRRDRLTRALAAKATDTALVVASDGRVLYLNPTEATGTALVEGDSLDLEGLPWVHPDDRAPVRELLSTVAEPGASACGRYRRLTADGGWRRVESTLTNCTDDPDIGGLILNTQDVTERVEAEDALRASETRYRLIAETAQEGIWATDVQGRTLYANQKMADLVGLGLPELYTRRTLDMFPEANVRTPVGRRVGERTSVGPDQYEVECSLPDGSRRVLRVSASPLVDDGQHLGSLAMVADVTEARQAETQLRHRALYDSLTGLPNRASLLERLQESLDKDPSTALGTVAVLVADIDQFKLVNDSLGHAAGDDLLVEVARRWQGVMRSQDTVGRLGGDEFVVLCEVSGPAEAYGVADRLLAALEEPIALEDRALTVSASIGIAVAGAVPVPGPLPGTVLTEDAATLLRHADAAMYAAKSQRRERAAMFSSSLAERARNQLELSNDLRAALQQDELALHYQPVVELMTGRLLGVEALCRWTHPTRGRIHPDQFIQAAEQTGLIEALDRWVLRRACRDGAAMRASGTLPPDSQIAVNVSAVHLAESGFAQAVRAALTEAGLPARALVLEVTESAVMTDPDAAQTILEGLQKLGVDVAIDDFGTGYSSLAYLRRFPVATLKIDRSFVEHLTVRSDDRAIVTAVIDLAHALNVDTIAEGIETSADLALLQQLGCRAGQGFLWSPAVPAHELSALLGALPNGRFPVHATGLTAPVPVQIPREPRTGADPDADVHFQKKQSSNHGPKQELDRGGDRTGTDAQR